MLVPLYTRVFEPHVFGIVTELYAYVGFLLILLTYGMETAFFRFSQIEKNTTKVYSTALLPLFLSSSVFILLGFLFAQPIANSLQYPENPEYIRWFTLIVGIDALCAIPFARLRYQNRAFRFVLLKVINISVNLGLNLFFLVLCPYLIRAFHLNFIHYIYAEEIGVGYVFISNLVASGITILLLVSDLFTVRLRFERALFRKMLIYALPLLLAGFSGMINEMLDRLMLKMLLVVPPAVENKAVYIMSQIGIYGANYKISIFMTLFIQAFRYAIEPFVFSQDENKNSKKIYADIMKMFVILGLFVFLGINYFIDIVKYFIDKDYHSGLHIVPVLLGANLFLGIIFNLSIWYKLTNKTIYGAVIATFGALITIFLNIILVPLWGYTGAAWATFFCYFSMMILSFLLGRKFYRINYDLKAIVIYVLITVFLYFCDYFIALDNVFINYALKFLYLGTFGAFVIYKEDLRKNIENTYKKYVKRKS